MNKTLLSYILTIGIAAAAGVGSGIVLKRTVGPIDEMYPPGFDPKEFSPNVDAIMAKYNNLSDKSINGVKSYSDADVINIVLEKYKQCENCYSIGIGLASTIVKQTIRNAQIKKGDQYFEEQISYSDMVNVAKRSIQNGKNGNIDLYNGNASGPTNASYPSKPSSTYTKSDYKNYLGKTLDEMFIYIISEKTVLDSKRTINAEDVTISLNLNPNLSTFYYKTQMLNISGLANLPPFTEVKLTYTFRKDDLMLQHLSVNETFTATKAGIPVPAQTTNTIENYYYPDVEKDIPDSSTLIDYSIQEE